MTGPQFSPFPFERLPRRSRRAAALESLMARWVAARGWRADGKLAALVRGPVRARLVGCTAGGRHADPHAAFAEVRCGGASITVAASSGAVRALAQRLLGGPPELPAPRPLGVVEQAIWALAVAAALADLDATAEVWPLEGGVATEPGITAEIAVELPAELGALDPVTTVTASFPVDIELRSPPPRPLPGWRFDLPIVVARCALPRASLDGLAVGDVITIEPRLELVVGCGAFGLSAAPRAVEAEVATEYVVHDMAGLDDAALELTVQLGSTRLSLRQLGELAIGQIVPLGRPLMGPYEVRAAGRMIAQGELVDIDGELGVRIVSIADQPRQASQE